MYNRHVKLLQDGPDFLIIFLIPLATDAFLTPLILLLFLIGYYFNNHLASYKILSSSLTIFIKNITKIQIRILLISLLLQRGVTEYIVAEAENGCNNFYNMRT